MCEVKSFADVSLAPGWSCSKLWLLWLARVQNEQWSPLCSAVVARPSPSAVCNITLVPPMNPSFVIADNQTDPRHKPDASILDVLGLVKKRSVVNTSRFDD